MLAIKTKGPDNNVSCIASDLWWESTANATQFLQLYVKSRELLLGCSSPENGFYVHGRFTLKNNNVAVLLCYGSDVISRGTKFHLLGRCIAAGGYMSPFRRKSWIFLLALRTTTKKLYICCSGLL